MQKYDIETKDLTITVHPTEREKFEAETSGTKACTWDYMIDQYGRIARRLHGSNNLFISSYHQNEIPLSVMAMFYAPNPIEINLMTEAELDRIVDDMYAGAIKALLWTENNYTDEKPDDTSLENLGYTEDNLDGVSRMFLHGKMKTFACLCLHAGIPLTIFDPEKGVFPHDDDFYTWDTIGFDFILSVNGHGAGLWDREFPFCKLMDSISSRFHDIHGMVIEGEDDLAWELSQ
jgi:hypothetical protein